MLSLLRSPVLCRVARRPLHPHYSTRTYFQSNALGNPLRTSRLSMRSATREVSSFREAVKKSRPEDSFEEKVEKPGIRNQLLVRPSSCFSWKPNLMDQGMLVCRTGVYFCFLLCGIQDKYRDGVLEEAHIRRIVCVEPPNSDQYRPEARTELRSHSCA